MKWEKNVSQLLHLCFHFIILLKMTPYFLLKFFDAFYFGDTVGVKDSNVLFIISSCSCSIVVIFKSKSLSWLRSWLLFVLALFKSINSRNWKQRILPSSAMNYHTYVLWNWLELFLLCLIILNYRRAGRMNM